MLKTIETKLRICIKDQLSKITPNWWKERIPSDIRETAEKRKTTNENLYPWTNTNSELIQYIDFNDYLKIITRKDNWREVFSNIFQDKDLITAKLKELDPIRNAIAHSRPISKSDQVRLNLIADDLLTCIDR
ncbi:MAG: Swt1 family HEPN domain-containing protein [Candidatus Hodarchaeales archaeon]